MLIDYVGYLYRVIPSLRIKWSIASRIMAPLIRGKGHEVTVEMKSPGGGRLIVNLDDWIPWTIFLFGRYQSEQPYEDFMMKHVGGCKVIIDVGANIGYYTVQFGRMLADKGIVYAFEPMSFQYQKLNRNIKLNNLNNISMQKFIVSDAHGETRNIYFSGFDRTGLSSMELVTDVYEEVECTTLDQFCERENIQAIDLIKIDVEGHEFNVLKGAHRLLSEGRISKLFVELNYNTLSASQTTPAQIVTWLNKFGYSSYSIAHGKQISYKPGQTESLVYFVKNK